MTTYRIHTGGRVYTRHDIPQLMDDLTPTKDSMTYKLGQKTTTEPPLIAKAIVLVVSVALGLIIGPLLGAVIIGMTL